MSQRHEVSRERDQYRDLLRELNYEPVGLATTGTQTEQIRAPDPDAVILHLQVGEEGEYGNAMAVQLRSDAHLANIPILVCTANPDALAGARKQLRDIGVPTLLKPVSIETIEEALRSGPTEQSPDSRRRRIFRRRRRQAWQIERGKVELTAGQTRV